MHHHIQRERETETEIEGTPLTREFQNFVQRDNNGFSEFHFLFLAVQDKENVLH